uniref:NR LBD domain-containing protein n=1 Tax=Caenorhabditis tropicalis TaxID=1561998 RepID=A0A1I7US06_9PELO
MDAEEHPVAIPDESNLTETAINILRRLHQHCAQRLEQIEALPNGSRTRLYHKLRRQLDVLDALMVMGRRPKNLIDQIRIMSLIFVDRELYHII